MSLSSSYQELNEILRKMFELFLQARNNRGTAQQWRQGEERTLLYNDFIILQ